MPAGAGAGGQWGIMWGFLPSVLQPGTRDWPLIPREANSGSLQMPYLLHSPGQRHKEHWLRG